MPKRPLLILPSPGKPVKRRKKGGGGPRLNLPSRRRQTERLTPRFKRLQQALNARRTRLQVEASGIVPEEVVVLETVGSIDGFIRAVEKVPGMEWLAEVEEEDIPPDDDFFAKTDDGAARKDKVLRGRLFMVFANQEALNQMLSLWGIWKSRKNLPHGLGRWKSLFKQLRDVRPWGVRDRLQETGVLEDWQERVELGQEVVPCEIELWFRKNSLSRHEARNRVVKLIQDHEGQIVTEATIEEIAYHALIVHLPVNGISSLLQAPTLAPDTHFVQCEQIQFVRASGQMASFLPDEAQEEDREAIPEGRPLGKPVVALFDGLPLQEHRRLQGRLVVDDPDGLEEYYPARTRRHGTAMASLILHGDLAAGESPFPRPLYVRPILRPDPNDWQNQRETVSEKTLVVDLLHRAVRRMFDGEGDEPPIGQDVAVINLSIGIRDRPFERTLSPLARLLDWLAWRYQVLFVVSAGNHPEHIELSEDCDDLSSLNPEELQRQVIHSVAASTRHRRLLSPAEAVNALTIAAVHDDTSVNPPPPGWKDPFFIKGLPSPINAQGMGYRRGIKPELLAPGGRVVVRESLVATHPTTLEVYEQALAPGQLVAAPGRTSGDQEAARHSRGTSNSTALVSRAAGLLYDLLEELSEEPGGMIITAVPRSIWLKALVAHGSDWGLAGSTLDEILREGQNSRQFREYVSRLLGYGAVDISRVQECTASRVTALSGGALNKDESHIHRFPLPPSLSGQRGRRRLTYTLAWISPVNPQHQGWRRAGLWVSSPNGPLRVERQQGDWQAVQRGTLQHEILEGEQAAAFEDGANLEIQVNCRADAGTLEEEVPYTLVTTLEVAEEIGVAIYDEVRVAVHAAQVRLVS